MSIFRFIFLQLVVQNECVIPVFKILAQKGTHSYEDCSSKGTCNPIKRLKRFWWPEIEMSEFLNLQFTTYKKWVYDSFQGSCLLWKWQLIVSMSQCVRQQLVLLFYNTSYYSILKHLPRINSSLQHSSELSKY